MTRTPATTHGYSPIMRQSFSIPSIIAVICVLLMLFTEWFDVLFGIGAIVFGLIGALMALSPRVRGGMLSIISIVLGVGAIIVSIFQLIF